MLLAPNMVIIVLLAQHPCIALLLAIPGQSQLGCQDPPPYLLHQLSSHPLLLLLTQVRELCPNVICQERFDLMRLQ